MTRHASPSAVLRTDQGQQTVGIEDPVEPGIQLLHRRRVDAPLRPLRHNAEAMASWRFSALAFPSTLPSVLPSSKID